MRITSGILRNRRFNVPKQDVRPTQERVREAIFSSLGGTCEGMKVLDLFAGAGGLGLEAWSRGAESVTFVEKTPAFGKFYRIIFRLWKVINLDLYGVLRPMPFDILRRWGSLLI